MTKFLFFKCRELSRLRIFWMSLTVLSQGNDWHELTWFNMEPRNKSWNQPGPPEEGPDKSSAHIFLSPFN